MNKMVMERQGKKVGQKNVSKKRKNLKNLRIFHFDYFLPQYLPIQKFCEKAEIGD
jgi:hypothetical protein